MVSTWWRKWVKGKVQVTTRGRRSARGQACRRLQLERLECRLVPATHTWSGNGNGNWSDNADWLEGAPSATETNVVLSFPAGASHLTNTNDINGLTVDSITLIRAYAISGAAITLTGNINGGGDLSMPITLGGDAVVNVPVANDLLHLAGAISGLFGLSIPPGSNGEIDFDAANTYTGGTTIANGTVNLTSPDATLGSGAVSLNGGVFEFAADNLANALNVGGSTTLVAEHGGSLTGAINLAAGTTLSIRTPGGDPLTIAGVISGGGGLSTFADTLTLNQVNTYSGPTAINNGLVQLGVANALSDVSAVTVASGATLDFQDLDNALGSLAGAGQVVLGAGNLTLGQNNMDAVFNGSFTGSGDITKIGTRTQTVAGASPSYSGTTTLMSGGLAVGNNNALGSGALVLTGGTLQSTTGVRLPNSYTVNGPAIIGGSTGLTLNGAGTLAGDNTLTVNNAAGFITLQGRVSGSGGIIKDGTGSLTLYVANTYTGPTTLRGGLLMVDDNKSLSTGVLTLAGGTLEPGGSLIIDDAFLANNFVLAGAATVASGFSGRLSLDGNGSGTGSLTVAGGGEVLLYGTNTYSGSTTVSSGILALGSGSGLPVTTALTVASGANFDLQSYSISIGSLSGAGNVALGSAFLIIGNDNTSTNFNGKISGSGGLIKVGTGTWTVLSTNTYTGSTTLLAGGLAVGNVVSPLGTGGLVLNGGTLQSSTATSLANPYTVNGSPKIGGSNDLTLTGPGIVNAMDTLMITNTAGTITLSGGLSGAGGLSKSNAGTLLLPVADSYTGSTTLSGGVLIVGNANAVGTGTLALQSGVLQSNAPLTLANRYSALSGTIGGTFDLTLSGPGNLQFGNLTVNNAAGTITLSGGLTALDGGQFIKDGAGTLALPSGNSLDIPVVLRSGTLIAGDNFALGGGSLQLLGGTLQSSRGIVLGLAFSVGAGATATLGGANDLTFTHVGSLGAGSTLLITNTATTTFAAAVSGTGGTLTETAGAGTLVLSGANTYGGGTTLTSGTLIVGNNSALGSGDLVWNGGTLQSNGSIMLTNSFTVGDHVSATVGGSGSLTFTSAGTLGAGSTLLITNTATTTFVSPLSGPSDGALTEMAGTGGLVLFAPNSYGGGTTLKSGTLTVRYDNALGSGSLTLEGGTLQASAARVVLNNVFAVGNAATVTIGGSGSLTFGGTGTLNDGSTLNIRNTATTTFAAAIAGSGALAEAAGSGTLLLSVASSYRGGTTLTSGTLSVAGSNPLGTGLLTLAGGLLQPSGTVTLPNDCLVAASAVIGSSYNLTLTGLVTLNAGITLTINNAGGTVALQGLVTGPGALTKTNAGALVLSHAANSYAGATTINGGTLQEANIFAVPNGTDLFVAGGATFDHQTQPAYLDKLQGDGLVTGSGTVDVGILNGDSTFSGQIIGTINLEKDGTGLFMVSGSNDYPGVTTIANGTLRLGSAMALSTGTDLILTSSAMLDLNGFSINTRSLSGSGTVKMDNATLMTGQNTSVFGGQFTGANGRLMKEGLGTLILANDNGTVNDYTGGTTVVSGTLRIGGDDRLPGGGAVTVAAGATLEFNAGSNDLGAASSISGAGGVLFSGGATIVAGTYNLDPATTTIVRGGAVQFTGAVLSLGNTLAIDAGQADFDTGAPVAVPTAALSGTGQLTGSDTLTVTNLLTWTGGTMAGGGMTMIGPGGAMDVAGADNKMDEGRIICNGGTTIWEGTGGIWLGGGGSLINEPQARFVAQSAAAVIATDASTPTFDNEGTLVKSAADSGVTTISAGIDFHNGGTLEIDAGTVFLDGGALDNFNPAAGTLTGGTYLVVGTLQFTGAGNFSTNDAMLVLDGSGPGQFLDENGASGLANFAVNDGSGVLILQNGYTLLTGGSFTNLGNVRLDPTSVLSVGGDYTQGSGATLEVQLGGVGQSGQVAIAGTANLDGTLTLTPVNGYTPATGDAFQVLTFAARNGSDFANPPAGFNEVFDDVNGNLTVVAQ